MLPAAAQLFGLLNIVNLQIFSSSGYLSCGEYNSPTHFYSLPLFSCRVATEQGLCISTHASSRKVENTQILRYTYEQLTAALDLQKPRFGASRLKYKCSKYKKIRKRKKISMMREGVKTSELLQLSHKNLARQYL
jgi:hypothetical protein